jgi:hypothetical protein
LTLDLSTTSKTARVELQMYATAAAFMPCSDLATGGDFEPTIWTVRGGILSLTATPPRSQDAEYPVTVTIERAVFEGPHQQRVAAPAPLVIKVLAGRVVGG